MFTTANIKKYLHIPDTDTSLDALIGLLIPGCVFTMTAYTNNATLNTEENAALVEPYLAEYIGYRLAKDKNVTAFGLGDYNVTNKTEQEALKVFKPFKKVKIV